MEERLKSGQGEQSESSWELAVPEESGAQIDHSIAWSLNLGEGGVNSRKNASSLGTEALR